MKLYSIKAATGDAEVKIAARLNGDHFVPFAECQSCDRKLESSDRYADPAKAVAAAQRWATREVGRHDYEEAVEADPFHGL